MKIKILILTILSVFVFSFAACGNDDTKDVSDTVTLVISEQSVRIDVGQALRLTAGLSNGKSSVCLWSSENESVVTVDNGLVRGVAEGSTCVVVQTEDGKYSSKCEVVVVSKKEGSVDYSKRVLGADISMLPAYQAMPRVYKDIDGQEVDFMPFVKEQGMSAMRVRLFVDPYNEKTHEKSVIQDLKYVKSLARQIKESGLSFMLDFHYSDYWADPAKQYVPAEWSSLDAEGLKGKLYDYTKEVLEQLAGDGLTPDYIQIGNEVSYGMLWPAGRVSYGSQDNWQMFSDMLSNASKACREAAPEARVIVHIERSEKSSDCVEFISNMEKYGVDYDILGLSYYPFWHGRIEDFDKTLSILSDETSKDIMIVEFAYYNNWYPDDAKYSAKAIGYSASPEGQRDATKALVGMLEKHPQVVGLLWWFPEENESPYTGLLESWTNRGLFDNETGKALPALYELKSFVGIGK
ncbi:MAG: glycosyl hydrolase 53 family protein [Bacteroidales bacterium]|nr:glycosyl hydrolase 53 family protein [Bacteroidales bacterium]